MNHYKRLLMIDKLNLPNEITHKIKMDYKYSHLQKKYDTDKIKLIQHIKYYIFLNNKINNKHKRQDTLLKTILFFDL
tara:strand:+ start:1886 stop:2116 length:231 start_codon:yes stop_codon:yes gene_type:complete